MSKYYTIYFKLLFSLASIILLSVYAMEYIWDMKPCKLCKYERIPYILLLIASCIGVLIHKLQKASSLLTVLILLASMVISFIHIGVENSWISYDSGCIGYTDANISLEAFKETLMKKELVPCDHVSHTFLGISLAGWNFIITSVLLVFMSVFTVTLWRAIPYDKY